MLEVVVAALPSAIAIAISPLPVVTVIIMLMAPRGARLAGAFYAGWASGILVTASVFALLAASLPDTLPASVEQVLGVVAVIVGIGLVGLAWIQLRRRPAGQSPALPVWLSRVDAMVAPAALGLAFILIAVNPKNVLVAGAAGTVIGRSDLPILIQVASAIVFAIGASSTVLLPVLLALWAPRTASQLLMRLRRWLTRHNAVITAVVLGALGIVVIISGISLL